MGEPTGTNRYISFATINFSLSNISSLQHLTVKFSGSFCNCLLPESIQIPTVTNLPDDQTSSGIIGFFMLILQKCCAYYFISWNLSKFKFCDYRWWIRFSRLIINRLFIWWGVRPSFFDSHRLWCAVFGGEAIEACKGASLTHSFSSASVLMALKKKRIGHARKVQFLLIPHLWL